MSTSQIEIFVHQVSQNPELQQKVKALSQAPQAEAFAGLVSLSSEVGAPVTAEEWAAAFRVPAERELADEELDTVAGGLDWSWFMLKLPNPAVQPL